MEAIAVNLARSYPTVVDLEARDAQLERLEHVTLGDWARVSEKDAHGAQLILGAYLGSIVSAYTVTGHTRGEDGRVRWLGHPADAYAGLIGQPLPGGDWRKGQARPLRKVRVSGRPGSAAPAMKQLLVTMLRYNHDPDRRELCEQLEERISVRVQNPTTVVIRVPSGVSVLVHPYPVVDQQDDQHPVGERPDRKEVRQGALSPAG